jgi:hypothetical protein
LHLTAQLSSPYGIPPATTDALRARKNTGSCPARVGAVTTTDQPTSHLEAPSPPAPPLERGGLGHPRPQASVGGLAAGVVAEPPRRGHLKADSLQLEHGARTRRCSLEPVHSSPVVSTCAIWLRRHRSPQTIDSEPRWFLVFVAPAREILAKAAILTQ